MTKIVAIVGPTGSGKTEIAIELSKKIELEIISADSRQVYKYLNIGTNKPSGRWEKINNENIFIYKSVPYHLVDFLEPDQQYDAALFYLDSSNLIKKICSNKKLPLIVGGTGFYIKTLTDGISFLPKRNQNIRNYLLELTNKYGKHYLYNMLEQLDPERAKQIHPNNIQRIIRSLEIILQCNKPFSELVKENPKYEPYSVLLVGIYVDKALLYQQIIKRTEWMLKNGMIEETKELISKGYPETIPAFSSIGYKWILKLLRNEINLETTKNNIVKDTMAYIKQQFTWFKKDKRILWINNNYQNTNDIINEIYKHIQNFLWKK